MPFRALALIAFLFFAPIGGDVSAAAIPFLLEPELQIEVVPATPAPGERVFVRAQSVRAPTTGATFVWRVNGTVAEQGIGRDSVTITAGEAGTTMNVSVSMSENGVSRGEKSVVIQPASIDLVWEGNTYRPPFYIGRPLMGGDGSVTITAVPTVVRGGARISAGDLVYSWFVNGSAAPKKRGYGVNTITMNAPLFKNEFVVSVTAETIDGILAASNQTRISPVSPESVVYENAPLLGIRFDRAIQGADTFEGEEKTYVAFPLTVGNADNLSYGWKVNGNRVAETGANAREVTLRRSGEGAGAFPIEFSFENAAALFERATTGFLLTF